MRLGNTLMVLVTIAYPALIYLGLTVFEPRVFGILLAFILALRHYRHASGFWRETPAAERWLLGGLLVLSLAIATVNREWLLRLYPAAMSFGMLAVFARSLVHPPSIIERIARQQAPDLSLDGIRYTRRVTQVWCAFLAVNGCIALATVFASRELWALWNGLLSYLCMGALFAGERLLRRRTQRQQAAA